jgi:hypothetical protein
LRSSSTLDLVFLANFLRRSYPDGRIVILGSDLTFIRERGSTGLSGAMTLSTYPLFPLARDWTEHQSLPAPDRTFGADSSEGTYIALRLLLNDRSMIVGEPDGRRCQVADEKGEIFLPSIACEHDPPIPDYSAPFWTLADQCGEMEKVKGTGPCRYPGPAVWLSVIGANRFWPLASLTEHTPSNPPAGKRLEDRKKEPGGLPEMPVEMKVFLLALAAFAIFHGWRCWSGRYTAALRHDFLVLSGSCCVAFSAIVAGWASGIFSLPAAGLPYPRFALWCVTFVWLMAWGASLSISRTRRERLEASGLFVGATALFCLLFVVPVQRELLPENRVLTYWRAMHLASGISPIVPLFSVLAGLYLSYWFTLRGAALFGPDRPCLPQRDLLAVHDEKGNCRNLLRMFSQEDAAAKIEEAAAPWNRKMFGAAVSLFVLFGLVAFAIAGGVPIHSLGSESYAIIFLVWLDICCTLLIVEIWRLYHAWEELRRLLTFLDRLPLRRTMAALRAFSWGTVWKMSANVLEMRYKVISRQMECMNHMINRLQEYQEEHHRNTPDCGISKSLDALYGMREAGAQFAHWYSERYRNAPKGDLAGFRRFQESVATASGTMLTQLLLPAWRREKVSLLVTPPRAREAHIRNAEEFVCLTYLGFIQNILGRLRTMALSIIAIFVAAAFAMSTYPFDPRQALSMVLFVLFVIAGTVIVKVSADMHRDVTLSHVTNTRPGELGSEFWFRIIGFGFAPLIGLLTRIFPGVSDFVFSWLQPGISALK